MKNHKTLYVIIFVFGLTIFATAQDVILKKDNTTILSKVVELSDTEIKYKKWSNQDGPTYTIKCQEVKSITYQNGEVETIETETSETVSTNNYEKPRNDYAAQARSTEQTTTRNQVTKPYSSNNYSRGRVQFSLNGGASFPLGKFGKTDKSYFSAPCMLYGGDELETGYGAAKTGFNASMKLHIPLYKDNNENNIIGLLLKFNFMYNGLSDKEKKDYRSRWCELGESLNSLYDTQAFYYKVTKYPSYRNFSFMVGADYTYYITTPFALFAEVNAGLNLAVISRAEIDNLYGNSFVYYSNHTNYYSEDKNIIKYNYKINFVYEIGGGILLFNHLSVGVFYTGYSPFQVSSTLTAKSNYGEEEMEVTSQKLKVSALSVQLGIHF